MITSLCQLRSNKVMMLKNAFGDPLPLRKLFISDQSSVKKSRIKFAKARNCSSFPTATKATRTWQSETLERREMYWGEPDFLCHFQSSRPLPIALHTQGPGGQEESSTSKILAYWAMLRNKSSALPKRVGLEEPRSPKKGKCREQSQHSI